MENGLFETLNWIGAGIAVILTISLSLGERYKNDLYFLKVLIMTLAIGMISNGLKSSLFNIFPYPFLFVDSLIFLIGPLVFLFIYEYIFDRLNLKLVYVHFIPALLYGLCSIGLSFGYGKDVQHVLSNDHMFGRFVIPWIYFLATVQTIIYLVSTIRMLIPVRTLSDGNVLKLPFLMIAFLAGINIFCLTHFLPYIGLDNPFSSISLDIIWMVIVVTIFGLNAYFIIYPDLKSTFSVQSSKYGTDHLEFENITEHLESLMNKQKVFMNSELTLGAVAQQLDTTKTTLSLLLNKHLKSSFYDYVNEKRIEAFADFVSQNVYPNLTYFGIAQESGFKSKATFYKAFKAKYKATPKEVFG